MKNRIQRTIGVSLLAIIHVAALAQTSSGDGGTQTSAESNFPFPPELLLPQPPGPDNRVYPPFVPGNGDPGTWVSEVISYMNWFVTNHENGTLISRAQVPTSVHDPLPIFRGYIHRSSDDSSGMTLYVHYKNSIPDASMPRFIFGGNFTGVASEADLYDGLTTSNWSAARGYASVPPSPHFSCLIMEMDGDGDGRKDDDAQTWKPVAFMICYPRYNRAAVYYYPDGWSREATPILYYIPIQSSPATFARTRLHRAGDPGLPLVLRDAFFPLSMHNFIIDEREEGYFYNEVQDLREEVSNLKSRLDALETANQASEESGD